MSGTEIVFLLGLAIVVVGPKRLPTMMRTAGQWVAKIRRMTSDVRQNTGIDKIIRDEGLEKEIRELSSLTRSPMFRSMMNLSPGALVANALAQTAPSPQAPSGVASPLAPSVPAKTPTIAGAVPSVPSAAANLIKPAEGNVSRGSDQAFAALKSAGFFSFREREYPTIGCDAYDALPDDLDDPDAYPPEMPEGEQLVESATLTAASTDIEAKPPVDAPTGVSPDVEAKPLMIEAPTGVSPDVEAKPSGDAPKEPDAAPKVENATTETNVETSTNGAKVEATP